MRPHRQGSAEPSLQCDNWLYNVRVAKVSPSLFRAIRSAGRAPFSWRPPPPGTMLNPTTRLRLRKAQETRGGDEESNITQMRFVPHGDERETVGGPKSEDDGDSITSSPGGKGTHLCEGFGAGSRKRRCPDRLMPRS